MSKETKTMKSYSDKPELKKMFVAEIKRHRKEDMIVQGTYGRENGTWSAAASAAYQKYAEELLRQLKACK